MQSRDEHRSLTDRAAIEDVIIQYAYRWDSKDAAGFADLFTEDAVMEARALGELRSRIESRSEILAYAMESHTGRLADRQTRHHMSGTVFIELSADSAVTENMVLVTHQTAVDAAARIATSGIYRNTWRKLDDGWKIVTRVLTIDRVAPRG